MKTTSQEGHSKKLELILPCLSEVTTRLQENDEEREGAGRGGRGEEQQQ